MTIVRRALSAPGQDVAGRRVRIDDLEATTSLMRHDQRGRLAPALLVGRLLAHSDPKVVKAGMTVAKAIERVEERLVATRIPDQERAFW